MIVIQVVGQVTNSDKQLNSPALSDPGRESTKRAAERVFSCIIGSQTSALENSIIIIMTEGELHCIDIKVVKLGETSVPLHGLL